MNIDAATRLICNELTRRTGYAATNLGGGRVKLASPWPLKLHVLSPPAGPGRPVERTVENLLRRAGELGWHPTMM